MNFFVKTILIIAVLGILTLFFVSYREKDLDNNRFKVVIDEFPVIATTSRQEKIKTVSKESKEAVLPSGKNEESPAGQTRAALPNVTEDLIISELLKVDPAQEKKEDAGRITNNQEIVATSTQDSKEVQPLLLSPPPPPPPLPPLDEESLLKSVVKIQCPVEGGGGKYIGSGFSVGNDIVLTAAHVIMDSGDEVCDIIFPKGRMPIHYLRGRIFPIKKESEITALEKENKCRKISNSSWFACDILEGEVLKEVKRRHDEEGFDLAALILPDINTYPEAKAIFNNYPEVPYPVCGNPVMIGDESLHFGYPSNFVDQNYLSETGGELVSYADIKGIEEKFSQDFSYSYKTPIFSYTVDQSKIHSYMISRVASFYGDSGGLAFNKEKQCVLGPHRGGTVGRGEGENFSVFPLVGWPTSKK